MQSQSTKRINPRDVLYRLRILLGSALAVIGLGVALTGYLPALLLILIAIPIAGVRRVAERVNIRF